jgi:hypothetical protein
MFRQGKDDKGEKQYSFLKRLCSFVIICKYLNMFMLFYYKLLITMFL